MPGPKLYGNYAYSRGRSFLDTGAIVKLIDYEGRYNIFKIGRKEPMGNLVAQFVRGPANVIPVGGASNFAEFRFTEPAQEGRLFQFRPIVFAVVRSTDQVNPGRILFPAIPDNVFIPATPAAPVSLTDTIAMGTSIQVQHPAGDWRWGTDQKRDVVVTTPGGVTMTSAGVGGVDGGFLEAPLAPFLDDPSDLWDMWTIFGHTIAIRMVNRTNFFWPPGLDLGAFLVDNKDYFVALIGAKYVLLEVSEAIKKKVEDREIHYQPIVIGGIPSVTTRA